MSLQNQLLHRQIEGARYDIPSENVDVVEIIVIDTCRISKPQESASLSEMVGPRFVLPARYLHIHRQRHSHRCLHFLIIQVKEMTEMRVCSPATLLEHPYHLTSRTKSQVSFPLAYTTTGASQSIVHQKPGRKTTEKMGIFSSNKTRSSGLFRDPIVVYHITHFLDGRLAVTPSSSAYNTYNILPNRPNTYHESIETSIVHANGGVVGHCVTQVYTGACPNLSVSNRNFEFRHSGHGDSAKYSFRIGHQTLKDVKWVHDPPSHNKIPGRRLKLEDGNGDVLACFSGAYGGGSEFAMLEIYYQGQAAAEVGVDWFGLVILTAVSVYLREERLREKGGKSKSRSSALGNAGNFLGALASFV